MTINGIKLAKYKKRRRFSINESHNSNRAPDKGKTRVDFVSLPKRSSACVVSQFMRWPSLSSRTESKKKIRQALTLTRGENSKVMHTE